MFESGLYQLIQNDPTLEPLVGQSVWFSQLPKGATFPAIVIHTISDVPDITLMETINLRPRRMQIDCISSVDQLDARTFSKAVKKVLQDFAGTLSDGTGVQTTILNNDMDIPYEVGARGYAYRVVLDLTFWVVEPG